MNKMALESVTGNNLSAGNRGNEISQESGRERTEKVYVSTEKTGKSIEKGTEKSTEKTEKFRSKNGDTLELSEAGKKISDSVLMGYSEAKLKQLYNNRKISKQQYERIMKRHNPQK